MQNALTVDLEDYYQVTAFAGNIAPSDWGAHASRVEQNTQRILELLATEGCRATFFTLGWVAEKYPGLVHSVASAGHEIACHSYGHRLVYDLSRSEFYEDTRRAKQILEDATGCAIYGYRAPSFSITARTSWAFDVLAELGFSYDSSVFPVRHPNYGMPEAPLSPYWQETPSGLLLEFPMPTLQLGSQRAPFGGGAYLRLLPYAFTRWAINYVNHREDRSVCVYVHPWEFDPEQPRLSSNPTARIRHYIGLNGMERKLRRLIADFQFEPLGSIAKRRFAERFAELATSV
jgi:polysaccharide deacetylase family protein (PEP-CTERM system associated)